MGWIIFACVAVALAVGIVLYNRTRSDADDEYGPKDAEHDKYAPPEPDPPPPVQPKRSHHKK